MTGLETLYAKVAETSILEVAKTLEVKASSEGAIPRADEWQAVHGETRDEIANQLAGGFDTKEMGIGETDSSYVLRDGEQFDAEGALKPGISYETDNGCLYTTDGEGRIDHVEGQLDLGNGTRNELSQREAGGADRQVDDDGGHLIANRFNGSGEMDNLVAMDKNVNRGAYKKLENMWARALEEGKEVLVDIKPIYEGISQRPEAFNVKYSIDSNRLSTVIENKNIQGGLS